ncbi:hypothetical protein [Accumulibacter sp.]|uniref:hypothetical protein n=1 Tax=Accumulibacter sp. TaxID=2053492 RepID=UPI0025EFF919|nr:hypothetical protein [Accumulibacter sp.]MCM8613144.1 hypothetical protein [Accumulibacter sp.]MCM8636569.1 hypothetical protein [Accumulibacter sp.]
MKFLPETDPLSKRFERSLRMDYLAQARLVAKDAPGHFHGDQPARGRRRFVAKRLVSSVRPGVLPRSSVFGLHASPRTATWRPLSRRSMPSVQERHTVTASPKPRDSSTDFGRRNTLLYPDDAADRVGLCSQFTVAAGELTRRSSGSGLEDRSGLSRYEARQDTGAKWLFDNLGCSRCRCVRRNF